MTPRFALYDLFPRPVGKYPYPAHAELKPVALDLCRSQPFYRVKGMAAPKSHTKLANRDSDLLASGDPALRRFAEFLGTCANHFAFDVMALKAESSMLLTSLWINAVHIGANEARHSHANSIVSGTYYLNFGSDHARLRFYRPRPPANHGFVLDVDVDPRRAGRYSWDYSEIGDLAEGDLLLWPSYFEHGYGENRANNRLTISMNFMPQVLPSEYSFRVERHVGASAASEPDLYELTLSDDVLRE